LNARLEALDRKDLSAVVEFYTDDADVDTRGLAEIGGRFHGREQIAEFYRVLFERVPEVRRTAEDVRLSVSERDALAAYDVRVEEETDEGTRVLEVERVADLWKLTEEGWKVRLHVLGSVGR
jgi:ketosteroid isomerase-like protein